MFGFFKKKLSKNSPFQKNDSAAVELRKRLLKTSDSRVHEQFAIGYAAIMVAAYSHSTVVLDFSSAEAQSNWCDDCIRTLLEKQGYHPTEERFEEAIIANIYANILYKKSYTMAIREQSEAFQLGLDLCIEAACALETQLEHRAKISVLDYLKAAQ